MNLLERFRGRKGGASAPDAGTAHVFRPMNDPGMGSAASGAGGSQSVPLGMDAVVTGNFVRELRCGVPGCGRGRDDPLHFPEG